MKSDSPELGLLAQLRAEFDREFAEPSRQERAESLEFLSFRAGGGNYAVALGEVAAVQEIRAVTRVPGTRLGFDGLVTFQDQLVAVFNLAVLIAAPQPATDCRWLLVFRADRQVGFSVDGIDGYQRAAVGDVIKADQRVQRGPLVQQAIQQGRGSRLVVDLGAVVDSVRRDLERQGQVAT